MFQNVQLLSINPINCLNVNEDCEATNSIKTASIFGYSWTPNKRPPSPPSPPPPPTLKLVKSVISLIDKIDHPNGFFNYLSNIVKEEKI